MDLRQSGGGILLEISLPVGLLEFHYHRNGSGTSGLQDHVDPSVALLRLRPDPVVGRDAVEDRHQDQLVAVLVPQIHVAALAEDPTEMIRHGVGVSLQHGARELAEASDVRIDIAPEHLRQHLADLPVGDGDGVGVILHVHRIEVSGHRHHREEDALGLEAVPIGHAGVELDIEPLVAQIQQGLQPGHVHIGVHRTQDAVGAGVGPVRLGREVRIDVVEDAPRIVHVGVPEAVAVVPLLRLLELGSVSEVRAECADLLLGESPELVESAVEDAVHVQVVQSREYARLGDLHHARDDGEVERRTVFERGRQEVRHESEDPLSQLVRFRLVDGVVVLVDEQDDLVPVLGCEHLRKVA